MLSHLLQNYKYKLKKEFPVNIEIMGLIFDHTNVT